MPRIDIETLPVETGSGYPAPYSLVAHGRSFRQLAKPAGISDFEINVVDLPEGAWSSQRHWHEGEDEFLVVTAGHAILRDGTGDTALAAGDCAAFPKNDRNGHHIVGGPGGCRFVVMGMPESTPCHYPDIDLHLPDARAGLYRHKDGTPF